MSVPRIHAAALISAALGAAAFRNSTGDFVSVTNVVPGLFIVTLAPDRGMRREDGYVVLNVNENPNPPRQCVANITHTSATIKTIAVTQEDAAGIGVLTDLEWSLALMVFMNPGT